MNLDGATIFELGENEELEIKLSKSPIKMVINPNDNSTDFWG